MIEDGRPDNTKRNFLIAFIAAFILAAIVFALNFIYPDNAMLLQRARADFDRGKYQKALPKFKKAADISSPGSGVRCEARIFYATCLVRENHFKEASAEFRKFINEYPSSFWTPQAYFDLAYAEQNQNNYIEAALIYKKIIADFPTTTWAKYSAERLEEFRVQKRLP
jgi:tetratricopeptide (TPR) repeat protein